MSLPAPIVSLPETLTSRYAKESNPTRSRIDPQANAAYDDAIQPLRDARAAFAQLANRYSLTHAAEDAEAFGDYAQNWAQQGGLLHFSNHGTSAEAQKNHSVQQFNLSLTLSTLGTTYAQVRDALPVQQQTMIDTWLRAATSTLEEPIKESLQLNNHGYWRAAARAAVGYALHDDALWQQGLAAARAGIGNIDRDSLFPAELQRGERALDYQCFAAMPLVMVAELASHQGIDLYQDHDHALQHVMDQRLIPALAGDLETIRLITDRACAQQLPIKRTSMPLFALYAQRFPSAALEATVNDYVRYLHANPSQEVKEENTFITAGTDTIPTIHELGYPAIGGHVDMMVQQLRNHTPHTAIHATTTQATPLTLSASAHLAP